MEEEMDDTLPEEWMVIDVDEENEDDVVGTIGEKTLQTANYVQSDTEAFCAHSSTHTTSVDLSKGKDAVSGRGSTLQVTTAASGNTSVETRQNEIDCDEPSASKKAVTILGIEVDEAVIDSEPYWSAETIEKLSSQLMSNPTSTSSGSGTEGAPSGMNVQNEEETEVLPEMVTKLVADLAGDGAVSEEGAGMELMEGDAKDMLQPLQGADGTPSAAAGKPGTEDSDVPLSATEITPTLNYDCSDVLAEIDALCSNESKVDAPAASAQSDQTCLPQLESDAKPEDSGEQEGALIPDKNKVTESPLCAKSEIVKDTPTNDITEVLGKQETATGDEIQNSLRHDALNDIAMNTDPVKMEDQQDENRRDKKPVNDGIVTHDKSSTPNVSENSGMDEVENASSVFKQADAVSQTSEIKHGATEKLESEAQSEVAVSKETTQSGVGKRARRQSGEDEESEMENKKIKLGAAADVPDAQYHSADREIVTMDQPSKGDRVDGQDYGHKRKFDGAESSETIGKIPRLSDDAKENGNNEEQWEKGVDDRSKESPRKRHIKRETSLPHINRVAPKPSRKLADLMAQSEHVWELNLYHVMMAEMANDNFTKLINMSRMSHWISAGHNDAQKKIGKLSLLFGSTKMMKKAMKEACSCCASSDASIKSFMLRRESQRQNSNPFKTEKVEEKPGECGDLAVEEKASPCPVKAEPQAVKQESIAVKSEPLSGAEQCTENQSETSPNTTAGNVSSQLESMQADETQADAPSAKAQDASRESGETSGRTVSSTCSPGINPADETKAADSFQASSEEPQSGKDGVETDTPGPCVCTEADSTVNEGTSASHMTPVTAEAKEDVPKTEDASEAKIVSAEGTPDTGAAHGLRKMTEEEQEEEVTTAEATLKMAGVKQGSEREESAGDRQTLKEESSTADMSSGASKDEKTPPNDVEKSDANLQPPTQIQHSPSVAHTSKSEPEKTETSHSKKYAPVSEDEEINQSWISLQNILKPTTLEQFLESQMEDNVTVDRYLSVHGIRCVKDEKNGARSLTICIPKCHTQTVLKWAHTSDATNLKRHRTPEEMLGMISARYFLQVTLTEAKSFVESCVCSLKCVQTLQDILKQQCSLEELKSAQAADNSLKEIQTKVMPKDEAERDLGGEKKRSVFMADDGILLRVFKSGTTAKAKTFKALLVPASFRPQVLKWAHINEKGNHLCEKESVNKLVTLFYWPLVIQNLKTFLKECEGCLGAESEGKSNASSSSSINGVTSSSEGKDGKVSSGVRVEESTADSKSPASASSRVTAPAPAAAPGTAPAGSAAPACPGKAAGTAAAERSESPQSSVARKADTTELGRSSPSEEIVKPVIPGKAGKVTVGSKAEENSSKETVKPAVPGKAGKVAGSTALGDSPSAKGAVKPVVPGKAGKIAESTAVGDSSAKETVKPTVPGKTGKVAGSTAVGDSPSSKGAVKPVVPGKAGKIAESTAVGDSSAKETVKPTVPGKTGKVAGSSKAEGPSAKETITPAVPGKVSKVAGSTKPGEGSSSKETVKPVISVKADTVDKSTAVGDSSAKETVKPTVPGKAGKVAGSSKAEGPSTKETVKSVIPGKAGMVAGSTAVGEGSTKETVKPVVPGKAGKVAVSTAVGEGSSSKETIKSVVPGKVDKVAGSTKPGEGSSAKGTVKPVVPGKAGTVAGSTAVRGSSAKGTVKPVVPGKAGTVAGSTKPEGSSSKETVTPVVPGKAGKIAGSTAVGGSSAKETVKPTVPGKAGNVAAMTRSQASAATTVSAPVLKVDKDKICQRFNYSPTGCFVKGCPLLHLCIKCGGKHRPEKCLVPDRSSTEKSAADSMVSSASSMSGSDASSTSRDGAGHTPADSASHTSGASQGSSSAAGTVVNPENLKKSICKNFNFGKTGCFTKGCKLLHVCAQCGGKHRLERCSQTGNKSSSSGQPTPPGKPVAEKSKAFQPAARKGTGGTSRDCPSESGTKVPSETPKSAQVSKGAATSAEEGRPRGPASATTVLCRHFRAASTCLQCSGQPASRDKVPPENDAPPAKSVAEEAQASKGDDEVEVKRDAVCKLHQYWVQGCPLPRGSCGFVHVCLRCGQLHPWKGCAQRKNARDESSDWIDKNRSTVGQFGVVKVKREAICIKLERTCGCAKLHICAKCGEKARHKHSAKAGKIGTIALNVERFCQPFNGKFGCLKAVCKSLHACIFCGDLHSYSQCPVATSHVPGTVKICKAKICRNFYNADALCTKGTCKSIHVCIDCGDLHHSRYCPKTNEALSAPDYEAMKNTACRSYSWTQCQEAPCLWSHFCARCSGQHPISKCPLPFKKEKSVALPCKHFNVRCCKKHKACMYQHICSQCGGQHPAALCSNKGNMSHTSGKSKTESNPSAAVSASVPSKTSTTAAVTGVQTPAAPPAVSGTSPAGAATSSVPAPAVGLSSPGAGTSSPRRQLCKESSAATADQVTSSSGVCEGTEGRTTSSAIPGSGQNSQQPRNSEPSAMDASSFPTEARATADLWEESSTCEDYNMGSGCGREKCRQLHICSQCLGTHPRSSCTVEHLHNNTPFTVSFKFEPRTELDMAPPVAHPKLEFKPLTREEIHPSTVILANLPTNLRKEIQAEILQVLFPYARGVKIAGPPKGSTGEGCVGLVKFATKDTALAVLRSFHHLVIGGNPITLRRGVLKRQADGGNSGPAAKSKATPEKVAASEASDQVSSKPQVSQAPGVCQGKSISVLSRRGASVQSQKASGGRQQSQTASRQTGPPQVQSGHPGIQPGPPGVPPAPPGVPPIQASGPPNSSGMPYATPSFHAPTGPYLPPQNQTPMSIPHFSVPTSSASVPFPASPHLGPPLPVSAAGQGYPSNPHQPPLQPYAPPPGVFLPPTGGVPQMPRGPPMF